jgi:hypothetical protein
MSIRPTGSASGIRQARQLEASSLKAQLMPRRFIIGEAMLFCGSDRASLWREVWARDEALAETD